MKRHNTIAIDAELVAKATACDLTELELYLRRSESDTWREFDTERVLEMVKSIVRKLR